MLIAERAPLELESPSGSIMLPPAPPTPRPPDAPPTPGAPPTRFIFASSSTSSVQPVFAQQIQQGFSDLCCARSKARTPQSPPSWVASPHPWPGSPHPWASSPPNVGNARNAFDTTVMGSLLRFVLRGSSKPTQSPPLGFPESAGAAATPHLGTIPLRPQLLNSDRSTPLMKAASPMWRPDAAESMLDHASPGGVPIAD